MHPQPSALLPHVGGYREEEAGAEREGGVQRGPGESSWFSAPGLFDVTSRERLDKKRLRLLFFVVSKHETAEGGNQAIRIKRYTESVFLPVRKLGGVGANKGKVRRAGVLFKRLCFYLILH